MNVPVPGKVAGESMKTGEIVGKKYYTGTVDSSNASFLPQAWRNHGGGRVIVKFREIKGRVETHHHEQEQKTAWLFDTWKFSVTNRFVT